MEKNHLELNHLQAVTNNLKRQKHYFLNELVGLKMQEQSIQKNIELLDKQIAELESIPVYMGDLEDFVSTVVVREKSKLVLSNPAEEFSEEAIDSSKPVPEFKTQFGVWKY